MFFSSLGDGEKVFEELRRVKDFNYKIVCEEEMEIFNKIFNLNNKIIFSGEFEDFFKFAPIFREKFIFVIFSSKADKPFLERLNLLGVNYSSMVLVGLREIRLLDRQFLDFNKIKYYEMRNVEDLESVCDVVMEFANIPNYKCGLIIDFSVIDPAFAPGVSEIFPAGFSSREIIYFSKRFSLVRNLLMVSLCGFKLSKDVENMTKKLGALVLKEFCK